MVVIVLVAMLMVGVVMGTGSVTNARVKSGATGIISAIRVAYNRASSTSKSQRVVLDMDHAKISLEESSMPMLVRRDDEVTVTGGAEASTPQEREALKETERILKGPQAPKPSFKPITALGFEAEGKDGKELGRGVEIKRFEVARAKNPQPQTEGRAYLYFWPGGMTERAAIQLGKTGEKEAILTVLVSALTGKASVVAGAKSIEEDRSDPSEREDRGF
jgi:general secretion pathway protein H